MRKKVLLKCPIASRSGYGEHSRDIARCFIDSDLYDIYIWPTPWGSTPNTALDEKTDLFIISKLVYENPNFIPDIFIQITIPSEFERVGKFNIGITAGIETTLATHDFVLGCNKMDLVLTTSKHSKDVLLNSVYDARDDRGNVKDTIRVIKPIEVLFEGVDENIFSKLLYNNSSSLSIELNSIPENFCFLHVGQFLQGQLGADRKDIGMLVKVFCDVFKKKPPSTRPALVLKTSGANFSATDKNEIQEKLNAILEPYGAERPNVYLLHGELDNSEMNDLYNHSKIKAMVSFTHGEGFGRPLLEFTITGKPVLASKWSGQLDFLNEKYSVLLEGKVEQVHPTATNKWIMKESGWFQVDYSKAAQKLFDVFSNYSEYLKLSNIQANITNNNFLLSKMKALFLNIVDDYVNKNKGDSYQLPSLNIPAHVSTELPKLKRIN